MGELEQAGTFGDLTQLGGGEDDVDRQLAQLGDDGGADAEPAMKAQLTEPKTPPQLPGTDEAPAGS